jgi:hypothetical protein
MRSSFRASYDVLSRTRSKGASVPAIIVLINLKEGVSPEDYERWILDSYAPAVKSLASVEDWRDYRVSGLLGSDAAPPYRYVVTLEVSDLEQLGRDMEGEEMQRHFSELHELAEITQIMAERFA